MKNLTFNVQNIGIPIVHKQTNITSMVLDFTSEGNTIREKCLKMSKRLFRGAIIKLRTLY